MRPLGGKTAWRRQVWVAAIRVYAAIRVSQESARDDSSIPLLRRDRAPTGNLMRRIGDSTCDVMDMQVFEFKVSGVVHRHLYPQHDKVCQ